MGLSEGCGFEEERGWEERKKKGVEESGRRSWRGKEDGTRREE